MRSPAFRVRVGVAQDVQVHPIGGPGPTGEPGQQGTELRRRQRSPLQRPEQRAVLGQAEAATSTTPPFDDADRREPNDRPRGSADRGEGRSLIRVPRPSVGRTCQWLAIRGGETPVR